MGWLDWLLHPVACTKRHNRRVRAATLMASASTRRRDAAYEAVMDNLHAIERELARLNHNNNGDPK